MPLKIIRNDITKMDCEAVVNTANEYPAVGRGCDEAVYLAAGYEQLLSFRKEKIGRVKEGEVFLTPGFGLKANYIIHAVSPVYRGGNRGEEKKLRSCYQKSLALASETGIRSIAFPLISTGSYHFPKEAGMRIAVDEINSFLLQHDMTVYLVVFDERATELGRKIYPELESYIDRNYAGTGRTPVRRRRIFSPAGTQESERSASVPDFHNRVNRRFYEEDGLEELCSMDFMAEDVSFQTTQMKQPVWSEKPEPEGTSVNFYSGHDSKLAERMKHLSDTFSEYLIYLIKSKGMTNAEVYKRAIVDKKVFSKIKNDKDAHPQKMTAMCLCIGAKLNMDEARDLLARAGYALSPSSKTDVIFSYFIENGIYDMIELDIQLEEYGLPCLIS